MDSQQLRELIAQQQTAGLQPPESSLEPGQPTTWNAVVDVLQRHYHEPDLEAARVLYSAVAAHGLSGQPVWPMAIAPPGSMKSELISALDGVPNVFLIDGFTPKTFLSGQIPDDKTPGDRPASLLHRIGKSGVILIPDFSTVESMKSDDRAAVYASLRKIYDGKFSKEFGTVEKVEPWEGRITVVAGTTPAIDRQRGLTQALGERFITVRWHRAGVEAAMRAVIQDRAHAHDELRSAVQALLMSLPSGEVTISENLRRRIVSLAEIAVRGRTHVARDNNKAVLETPEPESATRLAQQLVQLAKGSALIERRGEVGDLDFQIAKRAGFDSIPPRRLGILLALAAGDRVTSNKTTARYDVEDLCEVGLLESGSRLTDECAELFSQVGAEAVNAERTIPPAISNLNMVASSGVGGIFGAGDRQEVA